MSTERGLLIKIADLSPCASHVTYVHIIHRDTILQYQTDLLLSNSMHGIEENREAVSCHLASLAFMKTL